MFIVTNIFTECRTQILLFLLKNDIYCSLFMVLLNQFCDNLYWAWHTITCNTVFYLHEIQNFVVSKVTGLLFFFVERQG